MLKQNMSHKLLQKLSPQQIQLMKLLQIPTATLDQRVKEELEANPALEEGMETEDDGPEEKNFSNDAPEQAAEKEKEKEAKDDEPGFEEYLQEYIEDDTASYKLKSNNYSADDEEKTVPIPVESSFHEHLENQLGLLKLTDHEIVIAKQIIGSIDDDGYLRRETIALVDDLAFSQNVETTEEVIKELLVKIQTFDPPGIGAADLRECLRIQLARKLADPENAEDANIARAFKMVDKHFNEFSKKHFEKLKKYLSASDAELKAAMEEILKLNPKPASGYSSGRRGRAHYVVPDFILSNKEGELDLVLNSRNAPDLRISDSYKDMLTSYKAKGVNKSRTKQDKEAVMFIKQKIDAAKWFIDAIRQRQQTMYKTMYTILQYQYDYFLTGDEKRLRPMILKDIAEITGLDISTVSRVANSKYVQTEFGTKRLKDFFSESLQTDSGQEVSTLEVKKILTELIEEEDKRKPLSDEKLKNDLREKGYNIARRTVAKYREQLNIPVARLRKEL